jgi:hypothetical protein
MRTQKKMKNWKCRAALCDLLGERAKSVGYIGGQVW